MGGFQNRLLVTKAAGCIDWDCLQAMPVLGARIALNNSYGRSKEFFFFVL